MNAGWLFQFVTVGEMVLIVLLIAVLVRQGRLIRIIKRNA